LNRHRLVALNRSVKLSP